MADGFEENVEFFALTYEDPDLVQLGLAFEAVSPLLWLMAGAQGTTEPGRYPPKAGTACCSTPTSGLPSQQP